MRKALALPLAFGLAALATAWFTSLPSTVPAASASTPPSGLSALFPEGLLNRAGKPVSLDSLSGKLVGIYFSAHWCGPCRKFTPELVKYHQANREHFEVVFVSSDRTEEAQSKYMEEAGMPWPAVEWDSDAAKALKQRYEVSGIPTLVLVRDNGETLTRDGRSLVTEGVSADMIARGRQVTEEYLCGNCTKTHSRQKWVYDR